MKVPCQRINQRSIGLLATSSEAASNQHTPPFGQGLAAQRFQEPCLTDARLPCEEQQRLGRFYRALPAQEAIQQGQFPPASYQRRLSAITGHCGQTGNRCLSD